MTAEEWARAKRPEALLKYLEEVPVEASAWRGAFYIFDERISVDHEDFEG